MSLGSEYCLWEVWICGKEQHLWLKKSEKKQELNVWCLDSWMEVCEQDWRWTPASTDPEQSLQPKGQDSNSIRTKGVGGSCRMINKPCHSLAMHWEMLRVEEPPYLHVLFTQAQQHKALDWFQLLSAGRWLQPHLEHKFYTGIEKRIKVWTGVHNQTEDT